MRKYFGMYYPHTTLPDDWAKLAALYWDKIGRIEWPIGGWGSDSDVIRQLRDEVGFIVNLAPSRSLSSKVCKLAENSLRETPRKLDSKAV